MSIERQCGTERFKWHYKTCFACNLDLLLTFSALFQIEQLLLRNQSPHKVVAEQAYRLQQGLLLTSTQQQVRVEPCFRTFVLINYYSREIGIFLLYQNPEPEVFICVSFEDVPHKIEISWSILSRVVNKPLKRKHLASN